ncbi:hypothetical protein ACWGID_26215 [Kribbella sp. NPDC054772]
MAWLLSAGVFLLLCALLSLLLSLLLPHPPQGRWRRGLEQRTARVTSRLHRRAVVEPDPFDTLRLQTRLGHLSSKIRSVESTPHIYARAHRLMALEAAYDDLLDEACRLAGVPGEPEQQRSEAKRWHEEQELAARGWSW